MDVGVNHSILAQEMASTLIQMNRIAWQQDSFNGLRSSEFIFLASLAFIKGATTEGIKASDLGKVLHVTGSAVTHNLNTLEKTGYVERVSDPSDRRIVLVRLTEAGEQILELAQIEFLESLTGLIRFLGEKDSRELIRLLSLAMGYFIKEKGN